MRSAMAAPEVPSTQWINPRNSSLILDSESTNLITNDNCSFTLTSEPSSAKIEKYFASFTSFTTLSVTNLALLSKCCFV